MSQTLFAHWLDLLEVAPDPHDKPRVAVSACLLGDPVRYDGDHKSEPMVSEQLAPWLELVRQCPETAIGMPVPRPPVQLVEDGTQLRVQQVGDPRIEVSAALARHADALPADLDGLLLKARSPSCGVDNTPVHDSQGKDTGERSSGAFARAAMTRFPGLAVVNESHLSSDYARALFLLRCHLHHAGRRHGADAWSHWQSACARLPLPVKSQVRDWLAQTGQ